MSATATEVQLDLAPVMALLNRGRQLNDRAIGLIDELMEAVLDLRRATRVVHAYKGEGLTACGLDVVGPCPDCAEAVT